MFWYVGILGKRVKEFTVSRKIRLMCYKIKHINKSSQLHKKKKLF